MDNRTKEVILERLYYKAGVCACGNDRCADSGHRKLPDMLRKEDVLEAINVDEFFFQENTND